MYSFYSRIAYLKKQRQLAFIARHIRALGVLSLLGVVLILVLLRAQADSFYAGGTGTREDPYQIATCEQLQEMRQNLSSFYILINDIDCQSIVQGVGWEPVGKDWGTPFSGVLNGRGYTITNFGVATSSTYIGLFGILNSANVLDVTLDKGMTNKKIFGEGYHGYIGALAGHVYTSKVSGVHSNIPIQATSSAWYVGGLIGEVRYSVVTRSSVNASTTADAYIGGLIGSSVNMMTITSSYSSGSVYGVSNTGGLVGYSSTGRIDKTYSASNVIVTGGDATSGGLVGYFRYGWDGGVGGMSSIKDSFSVGTLNGNVASLVGTYNNTNSFANLQNSYFDQTGTGKTSCVASPSLTSSSGICQAVNTDGLSPSYFYASTSAPLSSWDFTHTWIEHASSTPTLATSSLYLPYSGAGSGTLSNPYQISSCTELQSLDTSDPSAYYVLVNDIDCTGFPFSPIGLNGNAFTGVLDG